MLEFNRRTGGWAGAGFGKSGGGNHQGIGYEGTQEVLRDSLDEALKSSGVDKIHIAGAGFGVAGYYFSSDRNGHLRALSAQGLA